MDSMWKEIEANRDIIYVDRELGIMQFAIEDNVFQIESIVELGCLSMSSVLSGIDMEDENLTAILFGLMTLNLYNYQTFGLGLGLDATRMNIVAFRNFYDNDLKNSNLVNISEDFVGKFMALKKVFDSEFQDIFVKKN
ncbi:MAG: type III secretion system chaperone [Puniceicoccales bacterium]|nr:type III secretion system chaperone [Puniceicoccales bacterium]